MSIKNSNTFIKVVFTTVSFITTFGPLALNGADQGAKDAGSFPAAGGHPQGAVWVMGQGQERGKTSIESMKDLSAAYEMANQNIKKYEEGSKQWDFYNKQIKVIEKMMGTGGNNRAMFGEGLVKGSLGDYSAFMQNVQPGGVVEGFMFAGGVTTGKVLGEHLANTLRTEGGAIWDVLIGKPLKYVKRFIKGAWAKTFNQGRMSYDPKRLVAWKDEVLYGVIDGLEKRARDAERNQANGRDAKMRSMMNEFALLDDESADPQAATDAMLSSRDHHWDLISNGYATDIDRIAASIGFAKLYYAKKGQSFDLEANDIVALSTRLQEILAILKENILLSSDSLRSLAEGDTKLFLGQINKDLERRFDLLIDAVCSYHSVSKESLPRSSASRSGGSRRDIDDIGLLR